MANRTCFLVDGFNVYHSIKAALELNSASPKKWLDIRALCASYLSSIGPDATLEGVFYFSALAEHTPDRAARHKVYAAALRSTGVAVQLHRFKTKDRWCPLCKNHFTGHEEKETDVAIALKILELFTLNACDTVVIVTGDTDLAPGIRTAKILWPNKRVWVLFPFERHNAELKAIAHGAIQIKPKRYVTHQLPNPVKVSSTEILWKPAGW